MIPKSTLRRLSGIQMKLNYASFLDSVGRNGRAETVRYTAIEYVKRLGVALTPSNSHKKGKR